MWLQNYICIGYSFFFLSYMGIFEARTTAIFMLFQSAIFSYACLVALCGGVTFSVRSHAFDKGWCATCEGAKWSCMSESADMLSSMMLLGVG
jgi:hypothetical protein